MLHYYAKKSFNEEAQKVSHAPMERGWVYGSEVTDQELEQVAAEYHLNGGILNDVHDKHELPRVEFSEGNLYSFIRMPYRSKKGRVITIPFLAIIKGGLLITLSSQKYTTPEEMFALPNVDLKSVKHLYLKMIGHTIQQFGEYVHASGKYVRNTERRLGNHEVTNNDFIKFVTVEGDLNTYKTNLNAVRVVLERLHENRHDTFNDKDCEYIEDLCLHVNQLLVSTESHMKVIDSIRNAYTTISNNTLNKRMKTLTLLTLLVALPNVFFGMFGMNVTLPFENEPWAYAAITTFSIVVVVLAYTVVRRKKF